MPKRGKRMGLLVAAWLLISAAIGQAQDERTQWFDVLHYDVFITVPDSGKLISGRTEIVLRAKKPFRRFRLDLAKMQPTLVERDGRPLEARQRDNQLEIVLRERAQPDEVVRVAVAYYGEPADGLIIRKNKYHRRTVFADNWPNRAHYWFPCVDHPSDKATVTFRITAPRRFQVVANGRFVRRIDHLNGWATTIYEEGVAIPTYCMVFGAAEFDIIANPESGRVPIHYWVFPQDAEDAIKEFDRSDEMLAYFENRFGPYAYEKLALVQSSTRFGGMENASAIFFSERSFGRPNSIEGTVAHEIAHQWFGDAVTPLDWQHLWLSEGFATYFGMQFFEYADGADRFHERLLESRERYLSRKKWHNRPIVTRVPEDLFQLLNPNNYTRGGWVLHMLRDMIGDRAFWKGIRQYVGTYRGRNVRTEDFRQVMETVSGRPLDWFFRQWVYQGGVPELRVTYDWKEKDKNLLVRIQQLQSKPIMKLPVELEIVDRKVVRKRVWLAEREKVYTFYVSERPTHIRIDPEVKLLAKFTVGKGSIATGK
ncbi:MAG: M1 family metallopeptidase [candidate division KSB1 bacterium]|nr:M1 family metallopeptidase [candidate division KSB1 bacterium]